MATRPKKTSAGDKPHLVLLQNPVSTPDGDGGYTQTWSDLSPATMFCKIEPATAQQLERVAGGTIESTASHIVTMDYHPGVTTKTRIVFDGRTLSVVGASSPQELKEETVAVATEVVP